VTGALHPSTGRRRRPVMRFACDSRRPATVSDTAYTHTHRTVCICVVCRVSIRLLPCRGFSNPCFVAHIGRLQNDRHGYVARTTKNKRALCPGLLSLIFRATGLIRSSLRNLVTQLYARIIKVHDLRYCCGSVTGTDNADACSHSSTLSTPALALKLGPLYKWSRHRSGRQLFASL